MPFAGERVHATQLCGLWPVTLDLMGVGWSPPRSTGARVVVGATGGCLPSPACLPCLRTACCVVAAGVPPSRAPPCLCGCGWALQVVREVLPSGVALRTNIDATLTGNVARFFNHRCGGARPAGRL